MRKIACALASVIALLVGCGGGSHARSDWRRPRPCTTDDDCSGGKCVLGEGQTQAACTGGTLPPLPPAPGTDGGARPPAPSIQPAPGDIQI